ncbi:MAG: PilZ domain-containing protein [Verrucomicrobiota bacterium]
MSEEEIDRPKKLLRKPVQRRRFYRLRYPENEGPRFIIDEKTVYRVFEISEGGARVYVPDSSLFHVHDTLEGELRFREENDDGEEAYKDETVPVKGIIIRIHESVIVIQFDDKDNVPLENMIQEQVRIRAKFPLAFSTKEY